MEPVLAVLAVLAALAAWTVFLYKLSDGRAWSPLWMAFSTTTVAALFLIAGTLGYTLNRHTRFVDGTAWTGGVIWWQVAVGGAAGAVAAYLWRKGVRAISMKP